MNNCLSDTELAGFKLVGFSEITTSINLSILRMRLCKNSLLLSFLRMQESPKLQ
ncbi:MAG: hypothetical protein NT007_01720 [Candidatus Kapabacteria bacterium]|nr:hypothetical protein [Candidatus Kapabacteria bacterium]